MTIEDAGDYKTEPSRFTTEDFVLWTEGKVLVVTPKFQRRPVWQLGAKSLLIDTILRGMTVPPLYMRMAQAEGTKKAIREVVDGQQRVRAVLEFVDPEKGFRLSSTLQAPWAGKRFGELTEQQQQAITRFGFSVEMFKGISDRKVFEVFCRLNMNGVQMNKQELRNGNFFGRFKQTSFALALEYLEFWRRNKIFTEQGIARMLEVELVSELLIAAIDGMQDKKKSIDDFYAEFDPKYPTEAKDKRRFHETMDTIGETFDGELAGTAFHRAPLFYTLYCVVFHRMFGLPKVARKSPAKRLTADERQGLRETVLRFSEMMALSKDPAEDVPRRYAKFIAASARQTDNIIPRRTRFDELYAASF